jgi:hypothetical protein
MSSNLLLARTDIESIIPSRLVGTVSGAHLDTPTLESRGYDTSPAALAGTLRSALRSRAIQAGERSEPSPIPETEAVDIVLGQLASQFPAWFGRADPDDGRVANPDGDLSTDTLAEWFFQGQVSFETVPVEFAEPETVDRVVVPLLTRLAAGLERQRSLDRMARQAAAKSAIKETVIREVVDNDLSRADVDEAVAEATRSLEQSDVSLEGQ